MPAKDSSIDRSESPPREGVSGSVPGKSAKTESWFERMRLVLRRHDQTTIVILLVVSAILIGVYVVRQAIIRQGLVDFDTAERKKVSYRIDLNEAEWPELANLPGIGDGTARAIIRYRDQHGPFRSRDELLDVPGIGPKKLATIKKYLSPLPQDPDFQPGITE